MEKLIAELRRLYLPDPQHPANGALADHLRADTTLAIDLATPTGFTRTLVLDFPREADDRHWLRLCDVANALQQQLKLPAPAVSVNGGEHFSLWLSFATPMPLARMRQFHAMLHHAYFADMDVKPAGTVTEVPPCLHRATGLWAAFINPAMGASLAEDLGLDMPPPISAQASFLHGLDSIADDQFAQAFGLLQGEPTAAAPAAQPPVPTPPAASAPVAATPDDGMLLKDATLEDIVAELHRRHIEPTLRHLLVR
ncbi:MAG: hypothetical protein ABW069_01450 [Duganella sp.]